MEAAGSEIIGGDPTTLRVKGQLEIEMDNRQAIQKRGYRCTHYCSVYPVAKIKSTLSERTRGFLLLHNQSAETSDNRRFFHHPLHKRCQRSEQKTGCDETLLTANRLQLLVRLVIVKIGDILFFLSAFLHRRG